MKAIRDARTVEKYEQLAAEMMLADEYLECDFRPDWILKQDWKVVPVEGGEHFRGWEIDRIVQTLQTAGYHDCVAVATEPMGLLPSCFQLAMTSDDLREFNVECGRLRFLITEETRSWAISCSELCNLFAGEQSLLEAMLGVPIEVAHERFLVFAESLASKNPEHPLLKSAKLYAAL